MLKIMQRELRAEVAGYANDINSPVMGGVIRQFDPTLAAKGADVHLYDSVLRDAHAQMVLEKRVNAYAMRPGALVLDKAATAYDKKAAAFVESVLAKLDLTRIRKECGITKFVYGYSPSEVMYAKDGRNVVVTDVVARDPNRFLVDALGNVRLRTWANMFPGEILPERKILWATHDKRNNNPYGRGLGAILWWLVWFKREQEKQLYTYSHRFASPTVVATVTGAGPGLEEATEAAQGVSGESEVVVSDNVKLSLLESLRHGSEMVFLNSIALWNEEMSKAVLTEATTTSNGEHAVKANGGVADDLRTVQMRADAKAADRELGVLITWLVNINFPGAKVPLYVTDVSDPNKAKKQAEQDAIMFSFGYRRDQESVDEIYGTGYKLVNPDLLGPAQEQIKVQEDGSKSPVAAGAAQVNINAAAA